MKINVTAMAATTALFWGGAVLAVGLINLGNPRYGLRFLRTVSSIYPGYHPAPNGREIVAGTAYAVLDGAASGALFAAMYNLIDSKTSENEYLSRAA